MTPEATAFLEKARRFQEKARDMLAHWPDEAGRASYLTAFHAAQALILERTGEAPKTHRGVHAQFARLTREAGIAPELRSFLSQAYAMKASADYEIGTDGGITMAAAEQAIEMAARLLAWVAAELASPR